MVLEVDVEPLLALDVEASSDIARKTSKAAVKRLDAKLLAD
jgi:hypothetical protein